MNLCWTTSEEVTEQLRTTSVYSDMVRQHCLLKSNESETSELTFAIFLWCPSGWKEKKIGLRNQSSAAVDPQPRCVLVHKAALMWKCDSSSCMKQYYFQEWWGSLREMIDFLLKHDFFTASIITLHHTQPIIAAVVLPRGSCLRLGGVWARWRAGLFSIGWHSHT